MLSVVTTPGKWNWNGHSIMNGCLRRQRQAGDCICICIWCQICSIAQRWIRRRNAGYPRPTTMTRRNESSSHRWRLCCTELYAASFEWTDGMVNINRVCDNNEISSSTAQNTTSCLALYSELASMLTPDPLSSHIWPATLQGRTRSIVTSTYARTISKVGSYRPTE